MNPAINPFAPGAGTRPPELAGRDRIIADASVVLERVRSGRPARSQMLLGLRGVGKTVLLNRISEVAEEQGYLTVVLEAPEGRRLAEMLVPPLRRLLVQLSRTERVQIRARKALGVLRSFASAFKVAVGDVEFGVEAEAGSADSGDLEFDLPEVLLEVAEAARAGGRAVALFIDEAQYLSTKDLAALIVSVHRIGQKGLPFVVFGAGLPQLAALAGEAKSYAERLFGYPDVGPLESEAAREAIREPIRREGAEITEEALGIIVERTNGYPYFLQEWGYHVWQAADHTPIGADDARKASEAAVAELDKGFFRVRMDRLTPREREYMRAMAQLGPGPHRSSEIARRMGTQVTAVAPLRNGLIRKGMIFSPAFGDTAFTVPMFDEFMRRSETAGMPRPRSRGR
jgi:hypothetical protein